jgi:pimeloyl-ACP methyl ester carboxylesterase
MRRYCGRASGRGVLEKFSVAAGLCRSFHKPFGIKLHPEDAQLLAQEFKRRDRELDEQRNGVATVVRLEGPTKYVGEEPDDAPGVNSDSAPEDTRAGTSTEPTVTDATTSQPSLVTVTEQDQSTFLYDGPVGESTLEQRAKAIQALYEKPNAGDVAVARGKMEFTSAEEEVSIMLQRAAAKHRQQGPYIGSKMKEMEEYGVNQRNRREIDRVPQAEPRYEANETSFRRLPKGARLISEHHVRHMYPMMTTLPIQWKVADCVDADALDIYNAQPTGIKYGIIYPENYDETRIYPVMVVLSDARGQEWDFEDVCASLFEREQFIQGLKEQEWIIIGPCINTKHATVMPNEGVVSRFVDWVAATYKCENGRPHLFGKGLGGHLALRTCTYHRDLVISVVAVLGRLASPFRPFDRPQERIRNMTNTHSLVIVPGQTRKLDWMYKWKALMDHAKVYPPTRFIHFAGVMDQQVYYAINPNEFWNYFMYFRRNPLHHNVAASAAGADDHDHVPPSWNTEDYKDYTDKNGDPLGTVTYEWLTNRQAHDGSEQVEKGSSKVDNHGTAQ